MRRNKRKGFWLDSYVGGVRAGGGGMTRRTQGDVHLGYARVSLAHLSVIVGLWVRVYLLVDSLCYYQVILSIHCPIYSLMPKVDFKTLCFFQLLIIPVSILH